MKAIWKLGVADKAIIKDIEMEYASSGMLRRRMIEVLQKKAEDERKKRLNENDYSSPSWAMLQADAVGYQRAMQEICSLLD